MVEANGAGWRLRLGWRGCGFWIEVFGRLRVLG